MMKKEFEELVGSEVNEEVFKIIETVYNYYDERLTKQNVADLYKLLGVMPFEDMYPRAKRIAELEQEIEEEKKIHQVRINTLLDEMAKLKKASREIFEEV